MAVNYIQTANMALTVPITGITVGPDWANEINACLVIVDSHDHSQGKGVAVTPLGLNINQDLTFGGFNATLVRSIRFQNPVSQPSGAQDVNCIYAFNGNLYYNNGGFAVQITNGHAVVGTPGSIANLSSPASATYVSLSSTFVWQSDANTPANMDAASYILRNLSANSKGLTLAPPSAMAADFTITLPALPGSGTSLTTINSSGAMSTTAPDGATIVNTGGQLKVPAGGITNLQAAAGFGFIPSGAMFPFGGSASPTGDYLICDGASYLRATYPNLFSAIGTAYGTADGTHFNVPDIRGLFLRGVTGASANDPDAISRTALKTGGATGNNVGSYQADQVGPIALSMSGGAVGGGTTGNPQHVVQSDNSGLTMTTNSNGTSETRPKNVYVNYLIKT